MLAAGCTFLPLSIVPRPFRNCQLCQDQPARTGPLAAGARKTGLRGPQAVRMAAAFLGQTGLDKRLSKLMSKLMRRHIVSKISTSRGPCPGPEKKAALVRLPWPVIGRVALLRCRVGGRRGERWLKVGRWEGGTCGSLLPCGARACSIWRQGGCWRCKCCGLAGLAWPGLAPVFFQWLQPASSVSGLRARKVVP